MRIRLKKRVKLFLLGLALVVALTQIGFSLDTVSLDELGNTCYGTFIKVCKEG